MDAALKEQIQKSGAASAETQQAKENAKKTTKESGLLSEIERAGAQSLAHQQAKNETKTQAKASFLGDIGKASAQMQAQIDAKSTTQNKASAVFDEIKKSDKKLADQ